MLRKLLKVTFYSIRKLQHHRPPTALPALTRPDRTRPDRTRPLAPCSLLCPREARPRLGPCTAASAVSFRTNSRDRFCSFYTHRPT